MANQRKLTSGAPVNTQPGAGQSRGGSGGSAFSNDQGLYNTPPANAKLGAPSLGGLSLPVGQGEKGSTSFNNSQGVFNPNAILGAKAPPPQMSPTLLSSLRGVKPAGVGSPVPTGKFPINGQPGPVTPPAGITGGAGPQVGIFGPDPSANPAASLASLKAISSALGLPGSQGLGGGAPVPQNQSFGAPTGIGTPPDGMAPSNPMIGPLVSQSPQQLQAITSILRGGGAPGMQPGVMNTQAPAPHPMGIGGGVMKPNNMTF
jgi:hypothetical protein